MDGEDGSPRWRRAIVLGASSGIGRCIAERLAREGATVAVVARRGAALRELSDSIGAAEGGGVIVPHEHDVRDTTKASALFQEMVTEMGGLDLVVYAAGIQPMVGPEEYPIDVDLETISTNFCGAVAWLDLAADRMSRAREGTIIAIGSVAGDRGRRGNPVYGATKAALSSFVEALRNRLAVRGVTVTLAKPGYVATPLLERVATPGFIPVARAEDVAEQILAAAAAGKRVIYTPSWWRFVLLAIRVIPAPLFERLNV